MKLSTTFPLLVLCIYFCASVRGNVLSNVTTESPVDEDKDYGTESNSEPHVLPNATNPYAHEVESLTRLEKFLLNSVEGVLKDILPTVVQSGIETNVSAACASSFLTLVRGLQGSKRWAYRMLDSSGKPPSGILDGTLTDFGSFEECLDIAVTPEVEGGSLSKEESDFRGQYCIMDIRASFQKNIPLGIKIPDGLHADGITWDPALQIFWARNHLLSFRYGICIPHLCSAENIEDIANYLSEPTGMEVDVNYCQTSKPKTMDEVQIGILIGLISICLLAFIGTSVEVVAIVNSESLIVKKPWYRFITTFSVYKNTNKLLESANSLTGSPLRHLDGIRFFSISWIILGHTYFFTDIVHYHHYRRIKQIVDVDDDLYFMPLANFTLSVDVFFFISGLLLVYANWKKLQICDGNFSFFEFIVHRVWRLWPTYIVTIGLILMLPLLGSGPLWPQAVESTAATCRKTWWANVLFINNFLDSDKLCLISTWFLSANVQFHIMGGFILYAIYKSPRLGISLSVLLMAASSSATFSHAYANDIRVPTVIAYEVFVDHDMKILGLYMMPYNHFGAYLMGIIVGYFLVKHKNKSIPGGLQVLAWLASVGVITFILLAPHKAFKGQLPSILESSTYYALHRTIFSIAIGWIIFACSTDRGWFLNRFLSWGAFGPLSNLSYLAYLIHPLFMILHTGRIRERIYFGHYEMVCIFLSRMVMTFFAAFVIHVLVEQPFASLERYFFPKKKSRPVAVEYKPNAASKVAGVSTNNGKPYNERWRKTQESA